MTLEINGGRNVKYLKLAAGAHGPDGGEGCLMEMVSFLAGEKWSDHPDCSSPVLGNYGRALNDRLPDSLRLQLTSYIPRLIGTRASKEIELQRAFIATDYAVRVFAPKALRARGRVVDAVRLEDLEAIVDVRTAQAGRASAAAAYDASDASAAAAYDASDASAAWKEILPLALEALDKMIDLGPGGSIPDDWFERAAGVI